MKLINIPNFLRLRCGQNYSQSRITSLIHQRRQETINVISCCCPVRYWSDGASHHRVCVVGSGPAGFYTAQSLLKKNNAIIVDILERLPVPFGLVRYGVAPDHPEVKNVINQFTTLAKGGRCNFLGNINIGKDVTVKELLNAYSAVVLSYGAESDKTLNIPGENCKGLYSARSFVGWYNGLPQDRDLNPDLNTDTAVVVGHGNVALDVARILLTPVDILRKTDIAEYAIEALLKSHIKRVILVGRRGPLQVAFTIKELREMIRLPGTRHLLDPEDFQGINQILADLPRAKRRLTELLFKTATESVSDLEADRLAAATTEWCLKFLRSPLEIISDENDRVRSIRLGINRLETKDGTEVALATGKEEEVHCGLVLRSIGYKSVPLDDMIPFDSAKGVIKNNMGRVEEVKGLYCSGWVKRGPVGVILSSLNDSMETAKTILDDVNKGLLEAKSSGMDELRAILQERGVKPVTFQDWLNIDSLEQSRGEKLNKPREKIADIKDMLDVAFKKDD